jgi:hypothetical protein
MVTFMRLDEGQAMRGETRKDRRRSRWSARAQTGINSQLRLFGLLALLVPLFGGLHYLVQEAAPRPATTVAREAEAATSVEVVPVDRVVERVVFVPVARMDDAAHAEADTAPAAVAATSQPITVVASAPEPAGAGSPSGTVVAAAETDPAVDPAQQNGSPAAPAEAQPSTPPLMGIVAVVPRTPPAPRSAAPRPAVTAPSDGPTEPEVAQDEDAPTDDVTANVDPQTDAPTEARLPHVVVSTLGVSGSPDVVTYVAGTTGGRSPGNNATNGQPPSDANDPDAVIQQP